MMRRTISVFTHTSLLLALLVVPLDARAQVPEPAGPVEGEATPDAALPSEAGEQPSEAAPEAPRPAAEVAPPAERSGPRLTLEEAQRIALERSPSLRSAALEIERAEAMIQQGWALILPSIRGTFTYQMADQPTVASFSIPGLSDLMGPAEDIVISPQHVVQLGLSARQPLFSPQAIPTLRMAHESRDLAELGIEQGRSQLALTVARAFYATVSARRTIGLLERQLELAAEHVGAARARLDAQAGLAIDVARAELQVELLRSQRENALLAYENARDAVALLMSTPPDDLPELAEPAEPDAATESVDDLVERAYRERVDLELARGQISIAERDLESVWYQFLPSLDLNWSLTHTLTEVSDFGGRQTTWYLVVMASIPLFDGGLRYGQLRDRRARLAQARLNEEALEQSVAIEVRQAYRAWRTALTTLESSQRQLTLAREAHRLAVAAYEAGAASNLEVVDAQRTLASAEVEIELQRLNAQLSLMELVSVLQVPRGSSGGMSSGGASGGGASGGGASGGGMSSGAGGGMGAGGMGMGGM